MFSPAPELRKSKSWVFNSLRIKKSNKNLRAGSGANDESKHPSIPPPLPTSPSLSSFLSVPSSRKTSRQRKDQQDEMDGIIDPAMLSNDATSPPSGFTAPESWSVAGEDGKGHVGGASSRLDDGRGGNGLSVSPLDAWEEAAAQADRAGTKRMVAQDKIRIRIYKADNTFHEVSVSPNATVAALTPKLDEKLPAGGGAGDASVVFEGARAGADFGADGAPSGYRATAAEAGGEEDLRFDNFSDIDLTDRGLRTIPVALYQNADSIVSLRLSRNPMIDIPLDFIQSCTTLRELRLSHMAMKQAPRSLRHNATLTRLDLSCNRIVTLDEAYFDDIPGLTSLHVQNNRLEKLPWSFPRLRGLVALNLSNNKFRTFPAVLSRLLNLCDLDISFNMISELPEEIGELRNLERLVIVGNQVSRLPDDFSKLERLRDLDCRRNQILDLTVAYMLPQIETLSADHNALHDLVLSMGPCLKKVDTSHNEITRLALVPGPVGQSPTALTSLDISNAKLSVLDDYILSQLAFLQRLNLDNNYFQALPDSLGELKWLEMLSCADNWLSALPQSIGELERLETLDVHRNRLTELPASLWNCPSLSQLNVTSNLLVVWHDPPPFHPSQRASTSTISDIPPLAYSLELLYLGQNLFTDEVLHPLMILKELRVLNLSYNNIRTIPFDFFRDLTNLEEVYLSGNGLTDFPTEDLSKLTRLSTLFLNGNRLQTLPQELGKVKNLTILDIGSNRLEYNINKWKFDWNWNFNKNLRYLNLSGNKRLQIKSDVSTAGQRRNMSAANRESLAGFSEFTQLRMLGLMDVTITTTSTNTGDIPDENHDRRVRTSSSVACGMSYGIADTLGKNEHLNMLDLVHEFGGDKKDAVFAMFGRAYPPKQLPAATTSNHLAKYLQENFIRVFVSQIRSLDPERCEGVPDALRRSFLMLNQEFHGMLMSSTRKIPASSPETNPVITDPLIVRSGASGIVVYICDKKMYVANVGNVLAVVSKGGSAVLVSKKHDPYDRAEIARIRAAEGWISPPGLVSDETDISRSFGYYYLMPIVNARPDIITYDLTELDEFVIIANRGLWDYVSYQTAVDIAQGTEPMVAAQRLRDFALSCGADGSIMIMIIGVADLFKGVSTVPAPDKQMLELAMLFLRLKMSASGHVSRPYSEWKGGLQGPAEMSMGFQLPPMTDKMTDADLMPVLHSLMKRIENEEVSLRAMARDCTVLNQFAFSSSNNNGDFKSPPRALSAIDDSTSFFKRPAVWPVILWIAFRVQTRDRSPESKNIEAFLAIIESKADKHRGLWQWDEIDDQVLRLNLIPQTDTRSSWIDDYPPSWQEYINLLDYHDWGRIETLTRQPSRHRLAPLEYDTAIRIGAVLLWTSSNSFADPSHLDILLDLETFLPGDRALEFWRCLLEHRLGDVTHSELNFRSEAVDWHRPRIFLDCNKAQLRSHALHHSNTMSFIHMVENAYMVHHVGRALPLNLMSSAFAWLSRKSEHANRLDEFRALINTWKTWDTTTCLINFRSVLPITFKFLESIEEQDLSKSLINDMMQTDLHCICAQVADILADPIARQDFLGAQDDQAQQLLDLLQDLLDYPLLDDRIRPVILEALRKLSVSSCRIPGCFALSDRLQLDGPHQVAAGGFADVWKGLIRGEIEFYHEALIWRQLSHPNLLPFFGLYHLEDTKSRLCLISPWMENGDITRYLKNNLVGVNRLTLILDAGLGLEHLHSLKLVHGDLKATVKPFQINVLVARSGRAVLADFGLASVADSKVLRSTSNGQRAGTARWQAPELFQGGRNSFASDVYAFSCVCYEIFTGDIPFRDSANDCAVIWTVMQGQRPRRSLSVPDSVWDLMEECWKANPEARPAAKQMVSRLRDRPICATPTDAASDWDPCYTSKFRSSLEEHTLFLSTGMI
ncbi:Adenylate cyclase [Mycena venus]|uniref:Adenylate cyclase n=1 Tax=Mycena venus TaxID=2733690 RepID=A0A8H6X9W6_9AGAR|nr:Adenylate cyclase [Mycena venus]